MGIVDDEPVASPRINATPHATREQPAWALQQAPRFRSSQPRDAQYVRLVRAELSDVRKVGKRLGSLQKERLGPPPPPPTGRPGVRRNNRICRPLPAAILAQLRCAAQSRAPRANEGPRNAFVVPYSNRDLIILGRKFLILRSFAHALSNGGAKPYNPSQPI